MVELDLIAKKGERIINEINRGWLGSKGNISKIWLGWWYEYNGA